VVGEETARFVGQWLEGGGGGGGPLPGTLKDNKRYIKKEM
jgi:hypothetical protein